MDYGSLRAFSDPLELLFDIALYPALIEGLSEKRCFWIRAER